MFVFQTVLFLLSSILLPSGGVLQATDPSTTISINAIAGLQYDLVRFKVKPGTMIKLKFKNADNMEHNLLITKPDAREKVVRQVIALADKAPGMDFNPNTPDVLYAIEVLAPGEERVLEFKAPDEEGIYPYVCTYSGHGMVMYGAMYVIAGDMPPIKNDIHIPEQRRKEENAVSVGHQHAERSHPYDLVPPYLYRIFMPESGPASIAVRLPGDFSYCWDAATCTLRYAWYGGFLDNSPPWTTKGQAMSRILGTVFYREKNSTPISMGEDVTSKVEYKGYKLVEGGYPEFNYTINGSDVYELIKADTVNQAIVRMFRIPNAKKEVFLKLANDSKVSVISPQGNRMNKFKLSSEEAKSFSIIIESSRRY